MAQYISKGEKGRWWYKKERHLPMELLTFTHLLGREELTEQYRQKVQANLNTPHQKGLNLRQYLAKQHLVQEDMKAFNPWMLDIEKHGMLIKVKNDLYHFPHLALDRLALLKEIKASDTFTRIDQLNKQEIIRDSAAEKLKEWMSIVLFMRLKTYSHYQAQQEMMNPLIKPFGFEDPQLIKNQFALDHEALAKVKKIYRIFMPFHEALQEFLAGVEEELRSATLDEVSFQMEGDIALRLLQYEEAKKYYLSAKDEAPEDPNILTVLGCISLAQGNLDQAAKYVDQALQVDIKCFGENHARIATDNINLVGIYVEQGKLEEAKEYAYKALKIDLKFLPENHLHIARDYNNLGRITLVLGDLEQANECFDKALKIYAELYRENHPNIAIYYNNLGMVYQDQKDLEKAAEYVKKALAIDQSYYGEYHPSVATDYNNLGTIYHQKGDFDEATKYCRKALEINLNFFGVAHPFVAENYDNLGQIYLSQNDLVKAIEYTRKSLEIFRGLYGENHPDVAIAYSNLGSIYQEQENLNEAAECAKKALSIDSNLFGKDSLRVGKRYNNLAVTYDAAGKLDIAVKIASKALKIYEKHYENHNIHNEDMVLTAFNLAMTYKKQEDWVRATECIKKALKINVELFGKDHLLTVIGYEILGEIYQVQGKGEEATKYNEKASKAILRMFDSQYIHVKAINATL
ncbi:tetratricopeptide repeat protein [Neochlamydia sp. AcF65]|uniref:tetratricopeptide repeat protein n=1 Tax=Neochlamydia sp. AcF65 TaxID=2795735 RepID=UPI001BC9C07A|nr:tetratricopeptide repeat protein [Neochlamydia sp. AcF65]